MLIEGGQDATGADLDTAEAYDPATASFTTLNAQMITPRSGHVGLTLPYNGKVLIAGGTSNGQPVADNELYDPVTGTFVANDPMSVARDEFAANFFALPAVGQVLLSGGVDSSGTPLALTETFSYQTIRTDKQDYPPGSPVIIYGTGWAPNETVLIEILQSNDENEEFSDTADSNGAFTDYNNFEISDADGGVVFQMTATGQTSGLTAQDRFTDQRKQRLAREVHPRRLPLAGPPATFTVVTVHTFGFATQTRDSYSITSSTLPASAIAIFGTNPVTGTPASLKPVLPRLRHKHDLRHHASRSLHTSR